MAKLNSIQIQEHVNARKGMHMCNLLGQMDIVSVCV